MEHTISRRGLIGSVAGLSAGVVGASMLGESTLAAVTAPGRRASLRIAHLTDLHIQPERAAAEGVAACLRHVQAHASKPDLIITGGDTIMDSFEADEARTTTQWDLWSRVIRAECSLPVLSVVGNHDIWGWNKGKSRTRGSEARWGKKWVCEQFARDKTYASTERAGWRIILLDSTQVDKDDANGYDAFLDEEQFNWLDGELKSAGNTPVLIVSHIPILSVTVFHGIKPDNKGDLKVSGGLMHTDFERLRALFAKHRNVKLCLSGHMHLLDRCELDGVTYICGGAVSGGWWKGNHKTCQPGYGVTELRDDGTFTYEYLPYGWVAREK